MDVCYGSDPEVPLSFSGVSGGGLWQTSLNREESGDIVPKDFLLSGVAFYQSELENGVRRIICHGRNSIYGIAYDYVVKMLIGSIPITFESIGKEVRQETVTTKRWKTKGTRKIVWYPQI